MNTYSVFQEDKRNVSVKLSYLYVYGIVDKNDVEVITAKASMGPFME